MHEITLSETQAKAIEHTQATSAARRWTGRIMFTLVVAFLLFDATGKLLQIEPVMEGARKLGYPESSMFGIGVVLATCVALYAIPCSSILGAVLLTGYLGGAVATHVRVGDPVFSHVLFPIYVAAVLWGALYLRDERVRNLIGRPRARLG